MSLITIDSILNPTSESIGLRNQILNRTPIPNWIKVRAPTSDEFYAIEKMTKNLALNTVCQEAACPNIAACWKKKHATFLAMGDICTRKCRFCNIKNGQPKPLDSKEPYNIAISVKELGLKHVVITSVDRDDLSDGGASHFVNIINEIRK